MVCMVAMERRSQVEPQTPYEADLEVFFRPENVAVINRLRHLFVLAGADHDFVGFKAVDYESLEPSGRLDIDKFLADTDDASRAEWNNTMSISSSVPTQQLHAVIKQQAVDARFLSSKNKLGARHRTEQEPLARLPPADQRLLHSEARLREVVLGRSTWEAADVDVSESTGDDDIVWEMVPLSVSVDLEDPSLDRSKALFYRTLDISSSMTNKPYRQFIDAHGPVRSLSC
ncbi:hypothetical protein QC762_708584 [Podospora pseudocomata]|uniref:Uncharacterized protein n=1 Tax=Podospora pseudocomata TaxID=2093779 RepID=A0ABR0G4A7_9PEZI|nr:hypothetical protein QC762_708584 [Podospora pseudocomata]